MQSDVATLCPFLLPSSFFVLINLNTTSFIPVSSWPGVYQTRVRRRPFTFLTVIPKSLKMSFDSLKYRLFGVKFFPNMKRTEKKDH